MKINSLDLENDIQQGNYTNAEMVQLIELIGGYLNLKTIPDYAKQNNMTYNGVKKCRETITLFGVKLVIDN
ncbi:MAG: hypothetical protein WCR72_01795 [Bacteroidota bacterium]